VRRDDSAGAGNKSGSGHNPTHGPDAKKLLHHLVGDFEHAKAAPRLGGLEVDHRIEFGCLHDRQIGGFSPLNRLDQELSRVKHLHEGYAGLNGISIMNSEPG
jgi:hypothetical protein